MAHPTGRLRFREGVPGFALRALAAGLLTPAVVGSTALAVGLLTYAAGGFLSGWMGRLVLGACVGAAGGAAVAWLQASVMPPDSGISRLRWSAAASAGLAAALGVASAVVPLVGQPDPGSYAIVPVEGLRGAATAVAGGLAAGGVQGRCARYAGDRLRWWPAISAAGALLAFLTGVIVGAAVPAESGLASAVVGVGGAGTVFVASTGPALLRLTGRRTDAGPRDSPLDRDEGTSGV